jgi:uncharacterized protein YkwD
MEYKIMRIRNIILGLLYVAVCMGNPLHSIAQSSPKADNAVSIEQQVLTFVNAHRDSINLPALKMNDVIVKAAISHSQDMATGKIPLGHDGFEERMGAILKQLTPANAAGENVLDGATSARQAVDLWLHSPGHRKNIEGNYNLTGISIVKAADGKLYFTQIFINKQ